jgi:choline dehydrogenase-like flavoprotein
MFPTPTLTRPVSHHPTPAGRAVVIGAGMGGLLTARVLADAYEQVTIVDRDELPAGSAPRKGVPQSGQSHLLLARGREAIDELLPGFTSDLAALGVDAADLGASFRLYNGPRRMPIGAIGVDALMVSRPLLEAEVRRRVRGMPNVEVLDRHDVTRLVSDGRQRRVTGLRVRSRDGNQERTLAADMVVDATGRTSRAPGWLEHMGYGTPADETMHVGIGYVTTILERRAGDLDGDIGVLVSPEPDLPRGGIALAVEGDR